MRAVVCDPVCALPYGHNAVAMNLFKHALERYYSPVLAVCCKFLDPALVERYNFLPHYDFYYHNYIKLQGVVPSVGWSVDVGLRYVDELECRATDDAIRLIDNLSINADDTMVFPSVDFYGAVGLFNALARLPTHRQPRLLIRFIGVMEGSSTFYRDAEAELVQRILRAREAGVRMSFSAETPKLADRLFELLNEDVAVTPYPDVHKALPMPLSGPFQIYCPGSARADKGFFELLAIFRELRSRDKQLNTRFVTQTLSPRDAKSQQNYISQLYAIPGLELLPSVIPVEAMLERFRRSSIVLLPYDRGIYGLRGSAAMMEAVCFGRLIVTVAGTAFAEQIDWYRLGTVVQDATQVPAAIEEYTRTPRAVLEARAQRGRARFLADVGFAYRSWLGETV